MLDDSLVITKHYDGAKMCDVFTFKFRMVGGKPGEEFVGIAYHLDDYSVYKLGKEELIHKMTVNVGAQLAAKYPMPNIALLSLVTAMREKIFEILANEYKANPKKQYNTGGYLTEYVDKYGKISYPDIDTDYVNPKNYKSPFSQMINSLPGVDKEISVNLVPCQPAGTFGKKTCPCKSLLNEWSNGMIPVEVAIIHLNDWHKMSREDVADWLQNLHDRGIVDIAFKVEVD